MPTRVLRRKPKPRALIVGFDDAMVERIGGFFPTWEAVEHVDEVEQQEWDVLVTTRSAVRAQDHLYVIGVGCDAYALPGHAEYPAAFGPYHGGPQANASHWVGWTGPSLARELQVAEKLPSRIEHLIVTLFAPMAEQERLHQWLHPRGVLEPFVSTILDQCLAGRFFRPGGKSECWCFPQYAVNITPDIVQVALQGWQKHDPKTFPVTDWTNKAIWRTPTENRVSSELDKLTVERATILAQLNARQEQLEAELREAKQSAETSERLLLTAQGDDLVNVVGECLSDLGFDIIKMDEVHTDERLEDLRITSPEPGWTALAEIKGYSGGGKSNDLLKFGRYWLRYFQEKSKEPDAGWYVVNQFLGNDPSTRRPILSGNEAGLSTFEKDYNGLAIDTADLFRLWMAVKDGRLTAEGARSRLMQTRGRFTFED